MLEDIKKSRKLPKEDRKLLDKLYDNADKRMHPYFDKDSEVDIRYYVDIEKSDE